MGLIPLLLLHTGLVLAVKQTTKELPYLSPMSLTEMGSTTSRRRRNTSQTYITCENPNSDDFLTYNCFDLRRNYVNQADATMINAFGDRVNMDGTVQNLVSSASQAVQTEQSLEDTYNQLEGQLNMSRNSMLTIQSQAIRLFDSYWAALQKAASSVDTNLESEGQALYEALSNLANFSETGVNGEVSAFMQNLNTGTNLANGWMSAIASSINSQGTGLSSALTQANSNLTNVDQQLGQIGAGIEQQIQALEDSVSQYTSGAGITQFAVAGQSQVSQAVTSLQSSGGQVTSTALGAVDGKITQLLAADADLVGNSSATYASATAAAENGLYATISSLQNTSSGLDSVLGGLVAAAESSATTAASVANTSVEAYRTPLLSTMGNLTTSSGSLSTTAQSVYSNVQNLVMAEDQLVQQAISQAVNDAYGTSSSAQSSSSGSLVKAQAAAQAAAASLASAGAQAQTDAVSAASAAASDVQQLSGSLTGTVLDVSQSATSSVSASQNSAYSAGHAAITAANNASTAALTGMYSAAGQVLNASQTNSNSISSAGSAMYSTISSGASSTALVGSAAATNTSAALAQSTQGVDDFVNDVAAAGSSAEATISGLSTTSTSLAAQGVGIAAKAGQSSSDGQVAVASLTSSGADSADQFSNQVGSVVSGGVASTGTQLQFIVDGVSGRINLAVGNAGTQVSQLTSAVDGANRATAAAMSNLGDATDGANAIANQSFVDMQAAITNSRNVIDRARESAKQSVAKIQASVDARGSALVSSLYSKLASADSATRETLMANIASAVSSIDAANSVAQHTLRSVDSTLGAAPAQGLIESQTAQTVLGTAINMVSGNSVVNGNPSLSSIQGSISQALASALDRTRSLQNQLAKFTGTAPSMANSTGAALSQAMVDQYTKAQTQVSALLSNVGAEAMVGNKLAVMLGSNSTVNMDYSVNSAKLANASQGLLDSMSSMQVSIAGAFETLFNTTTDRDSMLQSVLSTVQSTVSQVQANFTDFEKQFLGMSQAAVFASQSANSTIQAAMSDANNTVQQLDSYASGALQGNGSAMGITGALGVAGAASASSSMNVLGQSASQTGLDMVNLASFMTSEAANSVQGANSQIDNSAAASAHAVSGLLNQMSSQSAQLQSQAVTNSAAQRIALALVNDQMKKLVSVWNAFLQLESQYYSGSQNDMGVFQKSLGVTLARATDSMSRQIQQATDGVARDADDVNSVYSEFQSNLSSVSALANDLIARSVSDVAALNASASQAVTGSGLSALAADTNTDAAIQLSANLTSVANTYNSTFMEMANAAVIALQNLGITVPSVVSNYASSGFQLPTAS